LAALTDLVPPTLMAMSANTVDEDRQGMVQGVIASLSSLSAVLAPLVFTPMFGCSSRAIWASTCRARRSCCPRF
jgi:DHA1 family tetracycline resistance protein-like MFS transporter